MSGSIVETHELTVYYGKHRGIIDVDLTIEEGEVFGFLGPNGAGKTTTLNPPKVALRSLVSIARRMGWQYGSGSDICPVS
jgi:ABC-type uncharacterized transport system ATPase subunit